MYVLIENAAFINKGAELMLRSVIHELRTRNDQYKIAVNSQTFRTSPVEAKGCNLFETIHANGKIRFYPQRYLDKLKLVKTHNINVILDAGGFQFSDQYENDYSTEGNRKLDQHYKYFKSRGVKLIFLPQAFGPFQVSKLALERIQIVGKYADIIYARDDISYRHLTGALQATQKIRQCIDFTNIFKSQVPLANLLRKGHAICIVPNSRMITNTGDSTAGNYLNFMISICNYLQGRGEEVILLNHEGSGDEQLIHEIRAKLNKEVKWLTGLNAIEVKAVLGQMKMVISSRYHGVISALSQGITTFCTSWSHKYEEVMKDYGTLKNVLDINAIDTATSRIAEALNGSDQFSPSQNQIKRLEDESKAMWQEVFGFMHK